MEKTEGRGPDGCIDCVGMEAHPDVITHHLPLADAAKGYDILSNKQDNCEKWC
jgi:threonine dehydrogenase-like Zn-dependent dehydrogenase